MMSDLSNNEAWGSRTQFLTYVSSQVPALNACVQPTDGNTLIPCLLHAYIKLGCVQNHPGTPICYTSCWDTQSWNYHACRWHWELECRSFIISGGANWDDGAGALLFQGYRFRQHCGTVYVVRTLGVCVYNFCLQDSGLVKTYHVHSGPVDLCLYYRCQDAKPEPSQSLLVSSSSLKRSVPTWSGRRSPSARNVDVLQLSFLLLLW